MQIRFMLHQGFLELVIFWWSVNQFEHVNKTTPRKAKNKQQQKKSATQITKSPAFIPLHVYIPNFKHEKDMQIKLNF